jgi:hypothetical protein
MTDPDLTDNPWGDNGSTPGLMPDRLLGDLRTTFKGKHPDRRDHWHSNSIEMPREVLQMLLNSTLVFTTLAILYKSQVKLNDRLQVEGVEFGLQFLLTAHKGRRI